MVLILLFLERQKPPSGESGFCLPGENLAIQYFFFGPIQCVVDACQAQLVRPQPVPFGIQALAVDADRGLHDFCISKRVEMHCHFPSSFLNACCVVPATASALSDLARVVTTIHDSDGVKTHEWRAIFDRMNLPQALLFHTCTCGAVLGDRGIRRVSRIGYSRIALHYVRTAQV